MRFNLVQHKKRQFYAITAFLISALYVFFCEDVKADCTFNSGGNARFVSFTPPTNLPLARNLPLGTVIYKSPTYIISGTNNYVCTLPHMSGLKNLVGGQSPINDVGFLPIGTTGLAYRLRYQDGSYLHAYPVNGVSGSFDLNNTSYNYEVIKVGQVQEGTEILAGDFATWLQGELVVATFSLSRKTVISELTCTTPNISVSMGEQKSSGFAGVNTRLAPKAFNIALNNCPSGITAIQYRLDPTTSIINTTDSVVGLTNDSTASGVGVQILDNTDKPLALGTDLKLATYQAAGGNFTIPLKAAYYQVNKTIKGGTANTSLTFTMTYQ
ncbi:fimbrial protein [Pseudomonas sp. CCM 7893]|uniref:Fimbrial protein n=1 Tax=Pseudomonas spelaei TaxID=1055469 RepID=A0A6I3WCF9_9PSED|nr:fimbrial protein [Pseudomonas spelaei]MUF07955.1 fimbrial protein [Pseudomonas spelaei]